MLVGVAGLELATPAPKAGALPTAPYPAILQEYITYNLVCQ